VQRTADWLRGGINPNSNGTEKEIAQGLGKLTQQLHQAQQAMGQQKPGQPERGAGQDDQTAALSQVERLRSQLEAMAGSRRGNGQQPGQSNQQGRTGRPGQSNNKSESQQGHANGNGQQQGQPGRDQRQGQNMQGGPEQAGGPGGRPGDTNAQRGEQSGDIRSGGGGVDGTVWGNINTGNNRYQQAGQRAVPTDASGNPADTELRYRQGMRELSQLRQMVKGDSHATKEVQDLTRQMQQLDPSRFPGNPAMVEQMYREVLSSVDRVELQLQRDGAPPEARTGKPYAVPAGYQDSVAEYYRRLSENR